jgi:hypothetical protein
VRVEREQDRDDVQVDEEQHLGCLHEERVKVTRCYRLRQSRARKREQKNLWSHSRTKVEEIFDLIALTLVRQVGLNIRSDFERRVEIGPESRGMDRRNSFCQEILHVKDVVRASEYDTIGASPAKAEFSPTAKLAFGHEDKVANIKVS